MKRSIALFLAVVCLSAFADLLSAPDKKPQVNPKLIDEERVDRYRKWLDEDVKYVAQPEERDLFKNLTTEEEKQVFIENFWHVRDPDRTTPTNEFKEEHYRRIAYANERFASGIPGWMTDRGRIYIIHGEPTEIERHPSGGTYERPMHEGGGTTSVFPFEIHGCTSRYRSSTGNCSSWLT